MAKPKDFGDYEVILAHMEKVTGEAVSLPAPFNEASQLSVFRRAVNDGRKLLPARYQNTYVDVLEQAVNQAESVLQTLPARARAKRRAILQQLSLVFSTLAAPIVQLRPNSPRQKELRAFLAVISDVYKHFVDNSKIRSLSKTQLLYPNLDPLGSFNARANGDAYTLAASSDLPVALISKSANQIDFLPLWLLDGHEVGGHSVFTAVDGLQAELADAVEQRIREAFKSTSAEPVKVQFALPTGVVFGGKRTVTMEDFMVKLWRTWLAETAADAAGVLNMGPMFAGGLMLLLALNRPLWQLSSRSVFDGRRGFSQHPCDIIRALLAIELVKQLPLAKAAQTAADLDQRLLEILEEPLPPEFTWVARTGSKAVEIKLAHMQAVLPVVASAILASPLKSLGGSSLLEIMPWTDGDDRAVHEAATVLVAGSSDAPASVHARHVIAAAMLAAENASLLSNAAEKFAVIHKAGIAILNDMYDNQCLLCNVQTLKNGAKEPSEVQLRDLVRLVQSVRGR